METNLELPKQI